MKTRFALAITLAALIILSAAGCGRKHHGIKHDGTDTAGDLSGIPQDVGPRDDSASEPSSGAGGRAENSGEPIEIRGSNAGNQRADVVHRSRPQSRVKP